MAIQVRELQDLFQILKEKFLDKKDFLIKLDSVLGDGDLGLTMNKIFSAAAHSAVIFSGSDLGTFFMQNGLAMSKAAPSTMGSLFAFAFMEVGKNLRGREAMGMGDWVLFFESLQAGVRKTGKASLGEKTVLDVLIPAYRFLQGKNYENENALFAELVPFAEKCLKKTEMMEAQHGKAACFGEKSKGHVDAGASAAFFLIETIGAYFGVAPRFLSDSARLDIAE